MSDDATPRLALPYLAASQAQKHVTLNASLSRLDALVQLAAESRFTASPPASPADGTAYVVPSPVPATGPLAGFAADAVAVFSDGVWSAIAPPRDALLWCRDEGRLLHYDAGWAPAPITPADDTLARLGIGAAPDATNRLLARSRAVLFAAASGVDGGDVRLTLNKDAATDTASIIFQTGYSGRAEVGLSGDDGLQVKASADGSTWKSALHLNGDGSVSLGQGLADVAGGPTAGFRNRLLNGGFTVRQRGVGPAGAGVLADMWKLSLSGGAAATQAVNVVGGPTGQSALNVSVTAAPAGSDVVVRQQFEEPLPFSGRVVTLSGWAKGPSGATSAPTVNGAGVALTHTGGWQRFTFTTTLAASLSTLTCDLGRSPSAAGSYVWADVQLEFGPVATPFESRTIAVELPACRRFFRRYATAQTAGNLTYEMRATPTASGAGPYDYSAEF